jgi:phosphoserine aminotransferase
VPIYAVLQGRRYGSATRPHVFVGLFGTSIMRHSHRQELVFGRLTSTEKKQASLSQLKFNFHRLSSHVPLPVSWM